MNIALICLVAWAVAQGTKVALGRIREKRFDWRYFVSNGGMPSSHAAVVIALTTGIAITCGFDSPFFAISAVLAAIVIVDAAGVRRAVSRQSIVLNRIMRLLREQRPLVEVEKDLRELWGHSPFQVFVGGFMGFFIAWLWLFLC